MFADHALLKKRGVNYHCASCPERTQKLRRCREDREDFTAKDGNIWPMYVTEGQGSFGFCPGKATWAGPDTSLFQVLIVCAETGSMWEAGGVSNQPVWFVDLLAWFLPRYNDLRFNSRAKAILGDGKDLNPPKPSGR